MQISKHGSRPALVLFLLMSFGLGAIMLVNFGRSGTLESVFVFAFIAIFSLIAAVLAKLAGYEPFRWFDGTFDRHDIKYIVLGLGWIFGAVIGLTAMIPGVVGILAALMVGGLGLAYVLWKSQNFLVNVIVHATYNVLVIVASRGLLGAIGLSAIPLSSSPIFVPSFSFEGLTADNLLGQIFLNVFAVAPSEELLKISMAIAISLFTNSRAAMFGLSTAAWTGLHGVLSYPVS